jgi:acetylornithine/succinyldiaminopimelate/putrescine aminotransferase
MVPGFIHVEAGSIEALQSAVDDETAGILMEPIQGEGGVLEHSPQYVQQVRQLCDERGLALIFDEVWTGCGRTGRWFGYQWFAADRGAVEPDMMTLGKSLGGGLPVGALYAKPQIAALLTPGKHGCTLGGNAICMAVAKTIFDVIDRDRLTDRAAQLGQHAIERLRSESSIGDKVRQVRGSGLMLGVELNEPPEKFIERALANGIVVNLTAQKVVRLAPALTIGADQWDRGLDALVRTIAGE